MSAEEVKRNRYEGAGTHSPASHAQDYKNFHLPLDRMHHAALHGWGVAEGLEVKSTSEHTGVLVEAGIAVDAKGHLITLAAGSNNAVIWVDPEDLTNFTEADVPTWLDTAGFAGQGPKLYITIQYYEKPLSGGTGGQLAQAPYLRLQPTAGPPLEEIANGTALVLAIVTIDAEGKVTALQAASPELPYCRRSVGQTVEALHVRRSVVENNTTVKEALAGIIAADAAGGLRISAGLSVGGGLAVNGSIDLRETSGEINTDPFWIDRQSQGFNKSDLRIVIGDDIGGDDRLVIGPIPCGQMEMSEKFIFRNDGSAVLSGNVGIGTPARCYRLSIAGGSNPNDARDRCVLHVGSDVNLRTDRKDIIQLIKFGADGDYQFLHNTDTEIGHFKRPVLALHCEAGDALGFYSSGWKPLLEVEGDTGNTYVKGSLTIGGSSIGTASPEAKLEVVGGNLKIGSLQLGGFTDADQDEWPNVVWYRDPSKNWDEGLIKHSSTRGKFGRAGFGIHFHQSREFGLWSTGWDPLFAVEGETGNSYIKGNVGIGTAAPSAKLEVNLVNTNGWEGNLKGLRLLSPDNDYYLDVNTYIIAGGNVGYHFSPNGNTGLVISTLGNVGIGTVSPGSKLEIAGNVTLRSPNSDIYRLSFARTDESGRIHEWALWHMNSAYRKNSLEIWEYKTDSNGRTCDGNALDDAMCNPRLVILEGGNVGIGTTTPGARLDVSSTGVSECCSGGLATVSIAETGRHAWLQFHNSGEAEAYIRLAGGGPNGSGREGQRRFEIGDNQNVKTSLTVSGNIEIAGDVAIAGKHALRGNDTCLRLNQDNAFSSGVHTPGVFSSASLNVGGVQNWGDPGWGNAWIAGNVGIGTTPDNSEGWGKLLDVLGGGNAKLAVRTPQIDGRIMAHNLGWWGAPPGMVIGTNSPHPLSLGTGGISRLTIDADGNVSIASSLNASTLNVTGNAGIMGWLSVNSWLNVGGHISAKDAVISGKVLTQLKCFQYKHSVSCVWARDKSEAKTLLGVSSENDIGDYPIGSIWVFMS